MHHRRSLTPAPEALGSVHAHVWPGVHPRMADTAPDHKHAGWLHRMPTLTALTTLTSTLKRSQRNPKRHWFVLRDTHLALYKSDKQESEPVTRVEIEEITDVEQDGDTVSIFVQYEDAPVQLVAREGDTDMADLVLKLKALVPAERSVLHPIDPAVGDKSGWMLKHYEAKRRSSLMSTFSKSKRPSQYFFVLDGKDMAYYTKPGQDCAGVVHFDDVESVEESDGLISLFLKSGAALTLKAEAGKHKQADGNAYPTGAAYHQEWLKAFRAVVGQAGAANLSDVDVETAKKAGEF